MVIEAFKKQEDATPWNLLRNSIKGMCLSPEAFMAVRERFLQSYAAICVSGYILGIGDRHLENLLINSKDGEVFTIDFGIAFGSGIQLVIPELIPFRFTNQMVGVMAPYSYHGIFKSTMTYVYSSLKSKKDLLLDCAEIFVKDPLFDWVKSAQAKQTIDDAENPHRDFPLFYQQTKDLEWYPRKKIEIMKAKLEGKHPVLIMLSELEETKHAKKEYYEALKNALKHANENTENELEKGKTILNNPGELVECLIAMSRNPRILGRAWIGWASYL